MAPKKKGNKKGNEDWENELSENLDPVAAATETSRAEEDANDQEMNGGGGGLLAAVRKNKNRRAKKGKDVGDYVEGEDPTVEGAEGANDTNGLADKAPEEATADDLFDSVPTKGKGGKGGAKITQAGSDDEGSMADGGGGLKSKKEKEKERREREKQRKKEQVSNRSEIYHCLD